MLWGIPALANGSWLGPTNATQALLSVGGVALLFSPAFVWCERWWRGGSGPSSVRRLLIGLVAMLASFVAFAVTEPSVNATTTPMEFGVAMCGLGLSYWHSLRVGAALQQGRFVTGGSQWSANWLLGFVAFSPLGGLLPALAALLAVAALARQSSLLQSPDSPLLSADGGLGAS